MRVKLNLLITALIVGLYSLSAFGQSQYWTDIEEVADVSRSGISEDKDIRPDEFRLMQLDIDGFSNFLKSAPLEFTRRASRSPLQIEIPTPEGDFLTIFLVESPVMQPGLAAKFAHFRTFKGTGKDGIVTGRFDITSHGFHGIVFRPEGSFYIDPYNRETSEFYLVYNVKDNFSSEDYFFKCGVNDEEHGIQDYNTSLHEGVEKANTRAESQSFPLITYRIAIAATAQYTNFHGGTVEAGQAAIVTAVNRINSIFERDLGIRFLLVDNNDQLIFTDPSDQPYTNGNTGAMINENPPVLNSIIGLANYDIGHVFGTSSFPGGLAKLGTVCTDEKAEGVSTRNQPVNDPFIVSIVCHEIGHQFNARHTMYSCHNVNGPTAYEPGSGSTIMAYTGICAQGNNLQNESDPFFHANSLEVMQQFSRNGGGSTCALEVPTDNFPPVVEIPIQGGFHIPINTPFKLEAVATDENEDDILTYSWEQYDIGPSLDPFIPLGQSIGNSPLFRVYTPTENPVRYFPRLAYVVNNQQRPYELLPDTTRNLTFRVIVRDNNPEAGAIDWQEISFRSTANAGPFRVTYPNERDTLEAGQYIEVLWDVANTHLPPVNSQFVDVLLSEDGGFTYPHVLLDNAPNTGSAFVNIPNLEGTRFRIKVRAADNIFFDISDRNFIINEPSQPGVILNFRPYQGRLCLPDNLTVEFSTESLLGFSDTLFFNLTGELPAGAVPVSVPDFIIPGETATLDIDLSQTFISGEFELNFTVESDSIGVLERAIFYEIVSNNYSFLQLAEPLNGQSNVPEVTTFFWNDVPDAVGYEFQLATNPAFESDDLIFEGSVQNVDSIRPLVQLETGSIFYWRIRPFNICGFGPYTETFAFQTRSVDCQSFESSDGPINIPAQSTQAFDSQINVELGGQVNEIIIPNVRGNQPFVQDIELSLVSPSGREVSLVRGRCGNSSNYNLGFDDNAPQRVGEITPCTLTSGNRYMPEESLALMSGEDIEGNWRMRLRRLRTGSPGQLIEWSLEMCFDEKVSEIDFLRNDTLKLRPSESNILSRIVLRARSTVSVDENVFFTLVSLPSKGRLFFSGEEMTIGQQFSQKNIDDELITYQSDIDSFDFDHFHFVVQDEFDGWRGVERFEIKISDDHPTFVENFSGNLYFLNAFPNPSRGWVNYKVNGWEGQEVQLTVVSVDGKIVKRRQLQLMEQNVLDMRQMSPGIYFIGLSGNKGQLTQKIILE